MRSGWKAYWGWLLPTAAGLESSRNLAKWAILSTAVGLVAGGGAILFYKAMELATAAFLGSLVGYFPPMPLGEGAPKVISFARPWVLPLVTALGALISGVIVFSLAPEAEGHGSDAVIEAIHHRGAKIRARIPLIKLVASAITIGSGGSGGREGPTAQISAGFGSVLGQWIGASAKDRRILVAAGMGAGIGAIFRAPLGGAILAAEMLYIHDLEAEVIIPTLIAAIVGYSVFGAYVGFTPIFGDNPTLALNSPLELVFYAGLGALSGLFGILYSRCYYKTAAWFHRRSWPRWLKPALGGFMVGLMGLLLPQVLHTGYGWVQLAMQKESLLAWPLWLVLAIPFGKVIATSLSIGSGGSGGIFGPGMVIGGMLGALVWRVAYSLTSHVPPQPAPFVIVGMMALFGGIAHAPVAVMIMVAEMTGNLSLLAPAMIAVAISTALVGDNTIYRAQLRDRASSPFYRAQYRFPILSTLRVRDAMAPLTGERSEKNEAIDTNFVRAETTLDLALEQMGKRETISVPVVDGGRVIGMLSVSDAIGAYRRARAAQDVEPPRGEPGSK